MCSLSPPTMTRDVALRVAAASRELPEVPLRELVQVLLTLTGGQLTVESLSQLGERGVARAFGGRCSRSRAGRAVARLHGRGLPPYKATQTPRPDATWIAPATGVLRVGFASHEGHWLDGSLLRCRRMLIYDVAISDSALVAVREAPRSLTRRDSLSQRLKLVEDCRVVYTLSVGGAAIASLVRLGIYPVKMVQPIPCSAVLKRLQHVMKNSPAPWLTKAMQLRPQGETYPCNSLNLKPL